MTNFPQLTQALRLDNDLGTAPVKNDVRVYKETETKFDPLTTPEKQLMPTAKNVLGKDLISCSTEPLTGFYRDGCCNTGSSDLGLHLVCAEMTEEFLEFSKMRGNDLLTPQPAMGFPGLQPGDRWCLCVERWKEALLAGMAPPVVLEATHISALEFVELDDLKQHAATRE